MITVLGALTLLLVFFSLSSPHFFSARNLLNIGLYAAIMGTVACSMTFINVSGCIDLSVGSQIAVILGGAGLAGGKGTILGTLFGVLVLCTLNNGMVMLNIQSFWQQVVIGSVLIISVSIDAIKGGSLKKKI